MRIFMDTSAYAKRFIEEEGSAEIDNILFQATELGISLLCVPELLSAMNRKLREKTISRFQYSEIKSRFTEEINDIDIIQLTDEVIKKAVMLLEKNVLRTLDAIHIACAYEWDADMFLTSDKRQIKVAKKEVNKVKLI
jgi:predicted nucleic acid-binding protein